MTDLLFSNFSHCELHGFVMYEKNVQNCEVITGLIAGNNCEFFTQGD